MRILWVSFWGSWTLPLLNTLKYDNQIGIIIPTNKKSNCFYDRDQIKYYELALKKKELYNKMQFSTYNKYKTVIDTFRPDIIHIHGTEKNLSQLQNFVNEIPIVTSIQGLLSGYKDFSFNFINSKEIKKFTTLKNIFGRGGYKLMYKNFSHGISYELDILKNGKYFIGRTHWDKSHIMFNNPKAVYYTGEELLRDEFYLQSSTWSVNSCKRYSIFMPSGFNPIKGMHHAIKMVYLLKKYYPNIQLTIPGISTKDLKRQTNRIWGEEYIIYCINLIKKYELETNIHFLSRLDAKGMANEMRKAHVFISPSSIDNSPNAIGEASMIGTPIVTTYVGGVPSIFDDEKEVLFSPAGDPYIMAYQVKRIFDNDDLALFLSRNAHIKALRRHDKEKTTRQYINIYKDIIKNKE